jgi:hypothetical protein
MLAEPGTPHRRGNGKSPGTIMAAFGERPVAKVTTKDVSGFLRKLDSQGVSPRSVNKNRQVLSAMFGFACRADTHSLPIQPCGGHDQTPRTASSGARLLRARGGRDDRLGSRRTDHTAAHSQART